MRSKKPSREEALKWALAGEGAPSVLAWAPPPSTENLRAAAVVVGVPAADCVLRIAARFERIEALTSQPEARTRRNG
jgi:hypothetical protein